jgi:hypothetical protein
MTCSVRTIQRFTSPRVIALLIACFCLTGCNEVAAARFELFILLCFASVAFLVQVVATGPAVFRVRIRDTWRAVAFILGVLAAAAHFTLLVLGTQVVQDVSMSARRELVMLYGLLLWPGVFHVALPVRLLETTESTEQDQLVGVRRPRWSIFAGVGYVLVAGFFAYHLLYTGQFG